MIEQTQGRRVGATRQAPLYSWRSEHMVPNRLLIVALGVLATCGVTRAQSWAIELHDNGRLEFPWHSVMNTDTTVTMEGWFRQTGPMSQQMGFSRYQGSAEHKELVIDPGGRLRWLYAGQPWAHGGSCRETDPGVFPADGEWHHYAFSRHADHRWVSTSTAMWCTLAAPRGVAG